jgi:hypothetical protein
MNNLLVARVYSETLDTEHQEAIDYIDTADMLGKHYTWKRPNLDAFISYCLENFTVAVWTSARPENAEKLCAYVFSPKQRTQLLFEYNQDHCSGQWPDLRKNLSTVWNQYSYYNESNTLILDDSDDKMSNNPPSCVGICDIWTPWTSNQVETLQTVIDWLEERKQI